MAVIRVTATIDTDTLPEEFLDASDPTGLSELGFNALMGGEPVPGFESASDLLLSDLGDIEFKLTR